MNDDMDFELTKKGYCCTGLEEIATEGDFFEYNYDTNEYSMPRNPIYDAYAWCSKSLKSPKPMTNCPYCGAKLALLQDLRSKKWRYYVEEKGWNGQEFARYWQLYRQGASESEAEIKVLLERDTPPF